MRMIVLAMTRMGMRMIKRMRMRMRMRIVRMRTCMVCPGIMKRKGEVCA